MKTLFDSFASMLDQLPAQAVLRAVQLQCAMLADDRSSGRFQAGPDWESIVLFARFLKTAAGGDDFSGPVSLPARHVAFYREMVEKLGRAGEIPLAALERFEAGFCSPSATDQAKARDPENQRPETLISAP